MSEIPDDSGLRCPWCGYNLTALASNHCPECGGRFVLTRPGRAALPRHRSFRVSGAMCCPACGFDDRRFMPRRCAGCGRGFTLRERVFGTWKSSAETAGQSKLFRARGEP